MSGENRKGLYIGDTAVERRAGGFAFGWWRAEAYGEAVEPHGHERAHFMYVVGRGYTTVAAGEPARDRPPFVFNPASTFHRDRFEAGPGLFFTITLPQGAAARLDEGRGPTAPVRLADPAAYALAADLMGESARWSADSPLAAEALCQELAGAIGARLADERRAPAWLAKVVERLSEALEEDVSLTDLARVAGVHPFHLTRTFRRFHRCTPGEFRRARRLERAARLLARTSRPLAEVALDCGFSDQCHLTRHFSRVYGRPPGAFRRIVSS